MGERGWETQITPPLAPTRRLSRPYRVTRLWNKRPVGFQPLKIGNETAHQNNANLLMPDNGPMAELNTAFARHDNIRK
jgi:hypothetical protein